MDLGDKNPAASTWIPLLLDRFKNSPYTISPIIT
jgi:hypothetical protein